MTRALWPAVAAAQVDYETLRDAALHGIALLGPAAARFERGGLAGLIARPLARPVLDAVIVGATRAPWTPYGDPRNEAIVAAYAVLLGAADLAESNAAIS